MKSSWFARYILPGFVFKAAVIGGGYVSGRELAQFFGAHGPWGGLVGMTTATVMWSCVFAITLEFARSQQSYDYRTFFQNLLGSGWIVFELIYLTMLVVILSVLSATAGDVLANVSGLPQILCVLMFMCVVATVLAFGSGLVERFLSLWTFVLYAIYILLVIFCISRFGGRISASFESARFVDIGGSVADGIKYAGYNMVAMTAVLFCARHLRSRRDAIVSGLLGGPMAMVAGILFFISMSAFDPQIESVPVPVNYLLNALHMPVFRGAFLVIMFGTLIGTCTALIHAINERVAQRFAAHGRELPGIARGIIAGSLMILSGFVADRIGLVELVAKGYGYMAWAFILVFVIPVLTIGVWKLIRQERSVAATARTAA